MRSEQSTTVLKLGTRRSWLAWAQSSWVARKIEEGALAQGRAIAIELVGIETRGDVIQDVPLQQVEGKDFFVAELDRALVGGEVDLVVHSLKDLSLDRPTELALAAIPKREDPRDVIFFSPQALENLRNGKRILIGTSSPRRNETVIPFLQKVLPGLQDSVAQWATVAIRGNVNTRLGKVVSGELGAVVLAQAGVNRLLADAERGQATRELIGPLLAMQLPLMDCPTNPGQGALAVECRAADAELKQLLVNALEDATTRTHVERERLALKESGGGCHQRFGVSSIDHPELGHLMVTVGVWGDSYQFRKQVQWKNPAPIADLFPTFDASEVSPSRQGLKVPLNREGILAAGAVLITHGSLITALSDEEVQWLKDQSHAGLQVIAAGTPTWRNLARAGIWVAGSCEGLGQAWAESFLNMHFFTLTHQGALDGRIGQEIATSTWPELDANLRQHLEQARSIYWSSPGQFKAYGSDARRDAIHACGPGRTAPSIKRLGVSPLVFPGREEWKQWLNQN